MSTDEKRKAILDVLQATKGWVSRDTLLDRVPDSGNEIDAMSREGKFIVERRPLSGTLAKFYLHRMHWKGR